MTQPDEGFPKTAEAPTDGGRVLSMGRWPRRTVKSATARKSPVDHVRSLFESRSYEEAYFESDGLSLHYEVHGSGPRVMVFLHGILLDAQMNRRLAADLAQEGFRVLLLDLPGHGLSEKPRHASAHRIDNYAHHVIALLDELNIDQAVVGGVSLGANVSLQAAVSAPERVRALVVEMPVLEWAVPAAAFVFLPLLVAVHYAAPVARVIASLAKRLPKTRIGALDSLLTTLTLQPEETAAVLHGMIVGPITPTYEERRGIKVPALVIGHKIDAIHPFTDADHLTRQLASARLLEAHSILELRSLPDRLTGEVTAFLDEVWHNARLRSQRRGFHASGSSVRRATDDGRLPETTS